MLRLMSKIITNILNQNSFGAVQKVKKRPKCHSVPLSGIQNLFKNNNFLPEVDPAKAGMDSPRVLGGNDTKTGLFGQPPGKTTPLG